METIDSLETSILSLIKVSEKLRDERKKAYIDAEQNRNKLNEAKETIKSLQQNIEKMERNDQGFHDLEEKKKEIISYIQAIISRLDQLIT